MSLFKRINVTTRANLNALLDKAEDPVKLLNKYLIDMDDDIADVKNAIAKQLIAVQRFKVQYEEAARLVAKADAQARDAQRQDREDLARQAREDKAVHAARAKDYQSSMIKAALRQAVLKPSCGR
jgi:phage shock protein A